MGAELIRDLTAYLALVVAVSSLMGHWRAQRKASLRAELATLTEAVIKEA